MLDSIDDIFYIFDIDQELIAWNNRFAGVTGYADGELLGKSPHVFIRDQDLADLDAYLEAVGETGRGALTAELLTKSGDTIPYEFYSDALFDESGERLGRVGIARNVSERVRTQREPERQNERLDQFARTLAHDLRNPLNVSQGYLSVLEEELGNEASRSVASIRNAHHQIERIIADVLELSRTGQLVTEPKHVSIEELAVRVWQDIEHGTAELRVDNDVAFLADASLPNGC